MAQDSASDLERRLAQAELQLSEALERQVATDEVLRVIASSPGELELVFQAMLGNAVRICEAKFGALYLSEGDAVRMVATSGVSRQLDEELRAPDCDGRARGPPWVGSSSRSRPRISPMLSTSLAFST